MRFTTLILPLVLACSPFCVANSGSPAGGSDVCKDAPSDEMDDCTKNAEAAFKLQKALKTSNKKTVASLVDFPLEREHPLPPIEDEEEFLKLWEDFFDAANITKLVKDTPARMANGDVMLADGLVWFRNGSILNPGIRTKAYDSRLAEARKKEAPTLHPTLRGYKHLAVECDTQSKHIRIQEKNDSYFYFVWKKGARLTQKPELALKGTIIHEGSGGNRSYQFKNGNYAYALGVFELCEEESCNNLLTITKDNKQISEQVCK